MYKKLKEVLKEKGQKNEHNQYSIMLPNDQCIIYDEELDVLVHHKHESTNVKISRGIEELPYDEQYAIFKGLGIEPKDLYNKLQLYVSANGEISRDGLFKCLNLTPIQFIDRASKKRAVEITSTISTGQIKVTIIKEPNQQGFIFGKGDISEPVELEHYYWYQVPTEVKNEIQNQLGLEKTFWEKHFYEQLTANRERIKNLVKERGIKEEKDIYLQLPKRFGYSNSPFTVNDGKWVPTHSIARIILTETDLLFECNYVLDPYGTLDDELHYLKLEEVENLLWLRYLVWILENK